MTAKRLMIEFLCFAIALVFASIVARLISEDILTNLFIGVSFGWVISPLTLLIWRKLDEK